MTLRTLESLGDPRGQARHRPLRPQRPAEGRRDHRRRPHPRVPPDPQRAARRRAPGSSSSPTSAAPTASPTRVQPRAGRPAPLRAPRQAASASPPTPSASCGRQRSTALDDGDVALLENLRFNAARDVEGRRRARGVRRRARRSSATSSSPTDSASCTASRRASTSWPSCSRARPACSIADRARRARAAHREPRAALHGRARRLEGLATSSASSTHLLPKVDTPAHRRRHAVHLPRGAGPRGRQEPARSGPARPGPRLPRRGRASAASSSSCRPTSSSPSAFGADAEHVVAPADAIEDTAFGADGLGLDIGPETAARFAELIARRRRCSGTARWACSSSRRSPPAPRPSPRRSPEVDGLGVVGGGDSAAAVRALGFTDDQFGHISTGGGASLEFLEGKKLPGLEVLGWQ